MKRNQLKFTGSIIAILIILNSCSDSGDEMDPCLNGPTIVIDGVISSVEGQDTGEIAAGASGGQSPYMYSIDGTNFQNSNTFTDLAAGEYTVTVEDANTCKHTVMETVEEIPAVSYINQIRPILDANCQLSPCHGTNGNIPTYATYNDVKAKADRIKIRTGDKTMPPNSPLSDDNIKLIADWVDQGAPEN